MKMQRDTPLLAEPARVRNDYHKSVLDAHQHLGDLYAESGQTLQGSFSAVSKEFFASKYSSE